MASVDDASQLAPFAEQIFTDTFGPDNDPDNLTEYLTASFSITEIARLLARSDTRALLVEDAGGLAGYSMLRTADAPIAEIDSNGLLLQRFYLHQRLHGSGVADELLAETSTIATELGAPMIWLTVWEHNPRAIRFYEKRGFKTLGTCEFMLGKDQQTDVVMALSLTA